MFFFQRGEALVAEQAQVGVNIVLMDATLVPTPHFSLRTTLLVNFVSGDASEARLSTHAIFLLVVASRRAIAVVTSGLSALNVTFRQSAFFG